MKKKKVYIFIGTTAELIKIAPVISELKKRRLAYTLITSGQNRITFDDVNNYLGSVRPDISFEEKNEKSSVSRFLFWTIKTFFLCLFSLRKEFHELDRSNTFFIVHGDTVSSVIGALLAKIYGLKLVHVESGLRSFNFLEPFPEEICRYIVSHLSDINFCPNEWAFKNVEHLHGTPVNTKQNTLYESFTLAMKSKKKPEVLKKINKKYFVLVVHRQEHVIFGKKNTKYLIETILKNVDKSLQPVLIMHALTISFLHSTDKTLYDNVLKNVITTPRLPYAEFMKLLDGAEFIITDGGSNQEEAYYMGKPTLILRNVTERIEGLGENAILSKNNKDTILKFCKKYKLYTKKHVTVTNRPSEVIVDHLLTH